MLDLQATLSPRRTPHPEYAQERHPRGGGGADHDGLLGGAGLAEALEQGGWLGARFAARAGKWLQQLIPC